MAERKSEFCQGLRLPAHGLAAAPSSSKVPDLSPSTMKRGQETEGRGLSTCAGKRNSKVNKFKNRKRGIR